MSTALIIATYNWTDALRLCLSSILNQTVMPDEIIVADDGSREETRQLIIQFNLEHSLNVIHVWHEDQGFRLAHIRNKAVAASQSKYIIQIDGDIIMHKNFIRDHIKIAEEERYIVGSRVLLDEETSTSIIRKNKTELMFFEKGITNRFNAIHLDFLRPLFYKKIHNPFKIRGCNMSFSREDFIKVNGYNEDISGWGREDSELVMRMINSGLSGKALKFGGIAYHLYHKENKRENLNTNDDILNNTIKEKLTFCENGINKYL